MSKLENENLAQPANRTLASLIENYQTSRNSTKGITQERPVRVGLLSEPNDANLETKWIENCERFQVYKIPTASTTVTKDSNISDSYDIVIDLSDDTNSMKALTAQRASTLIANDGVVLIRSETKSVRNLAGDTQRNCLGIAVGEWSGHHIIELIASDTTSSQTIERACDFARSIADVTLITKAETRGLIWRIQCSYLIEAMALLGEAADPAQIEQHALQAGMRCAPLLELDNISLKLMDHVLHEELHDLSHAGQSGEAHHHHGHGHDHDDHHEHSHHDHKHGAHEHSHDVASQLMPESAVYVLEKMAHGFDRLGARFGAGFYDYDYDDDPPELWDGLSAFARGSNRVDPGDIRDRLLYAPAIESLRCLDARLIDDVQSANLGATLGAGFSATLDGPIGMIQTIGADAFAVRAGELAARYGDRFTLPASWQSLIR